MKRLRTATKLTLAAILVMAMASCSSENKSEGETTTESAQSSQTQQSESSDSSSEATKTDEDPSPAELKKVTFRQEWIPNGMYASIYYGIQNGVFAKYGIDLEAAAGNGSNATIDDVQSGRSEFGMSSCPAMILKAGTGMDVMSVAAFTGKYSWAFYLPVDDPAQTISDMEGYTYSESPASSGASLMPAVLQAANMEADALKMIAVDPSQKNGVYARGQSNSTITTVAFGEPIIQDLIPSKSIRWADSGFVMPDYCYIASRQTVEQDPELVQSFVTAALESIELAVENPEDAIEAAAAFDELVDPKVASVQWQKTQEFFQSESQEQSGCALGWQSPDDWKTGIQTLKQYGGLSESVDESEDNLYTNKFVQC